MKEYFKKTIPKIEKEVREFFPERIDDIWVKKNIGDALYKFDCNVWQKAFSRPFYNLFDRGGKRIRPVLCCLMHDALDGNFKDIHKFSIISEIIHTGTLIIDDIEDNSETRRGDRVIHKIHGQEIAINNGVFLHFFPQLIINNSDLPNKEKIKLYSVISSELTKIHLGQGMDILWSKLRRFDVSVDEYLQMAAYKTSALLSVALKTGVMLSDVDENILEKIENISEKIGVAFQIQDDILNLKSDIGWGKEIGEDITEGKITYMVCDTFFRVNDKDRKILINTLSSHVRDKKEVERAIEILEKYNSFARASKFAKKLIFEAKNDIDDMLEDSEYKRIFLEIMDYTINRSK